MALCPQCKQALPDDQRFCRACGADRTAAEADAQPVEIDPEVIDAPTASGDGGDGSTTDGDAPPKKKRGQGISLLEIGVVLAVIAILSSVAGPMVSTGDGGGGRVTATKSGMSNLKTALTQYVADCVRYPHMGNASCYDAANIDAADAVFGTNLNDNVLFNVDCSTVPGWQELGHSWQTYRRRWKGPYMETTPDDFMMDAWQNRFRYRTCGKMIYLWSAGTDGAFADREFYLAAGNENYDNSSNDDIIMPIGRFRK